MPIYSIENPWLYRAVLAFAAIGVVATLCGAVALVLWALGVQDG